MTTILGNIFISPMSSNIWWVAPSSPRVNPAWEAHTFTFLLEYAIDWRIWSYTRPVEKAAKVPVKGIFPPMVRPAAIPIILASAMPTWKKRVGFSSWNFSILSEPMRSAQSATTLGFLRPSSASPAPKPLRVSFLPVSVYFFIRYYFLTFLFLNLSLSSTKKRLNNIKGTLITLSSGHMIFLIKVSFTSNSPRYNSPRL